MKINSELPLCMMGLNNKLNEYDFVLFHLFESNQKYRNYFKSQRTYFPDRFMIFDNSAYEYFVKGETLDLEKFYEAICELKPDMYILPDVLMNKEKTIDGVTEFLEKYGELIEEKTKGKSKPLAVAQGDTEGELLECLGMYHNMNIYNVALPFHNSFFVSEMYENAIPDIKVYFSQYYKSFDDLDKKYAMGRMQFVKKHEKILLEFNHVHLLGSHCPFEKTFYGRVIDTMDTGYPVKCAMEGIMLGYEKEKPNIIIDEFLEDELPDNVRMLIGLNVDIFRKL